MATYKVPQDVEADDKLIGPFSFRQFMYLVIVALAGAAAWGLAQLFIGLAVIPLPVILLFGVLALPLRKDQPMEIYLAALISFYLKPRKRLWDSDGIESLIEITVPKTAEIHLTKDITSEDADQRFSYLANIVDSQGWAIRGAAGQSGAMNTDIYLEAQGAQDVLDTSNSVAQSFQSMMTKEAEKAKAEAIERMRQAPTMPAAPAADPQTLGYNPYPTDIHQALVQPVNDPGHVYSAPATQSDPQTPPTTSDKPVSADIMNLANNTDLSIETIAHEARRLQEKENDLSEEVVVSLR
jgi:hypothetical protein